MYLSRNIYQNELGQASFQYDMAYGDFKDLPRGTASEKVLCDKSFNVAKNPKYDGYQKGLVMAYKIAYKCLIKSLLVVVLKVKLC